MATAAAKPRTRKCPKTGAVFTEGDRYLINLETGNVVPWGKWAAQLHYTRPYDPFNEDLHIKLEKDIYGMTRNELFAYCRKHHRKRHVEDTWTKQDLVREITLWENPQLANLIDESDFPDEIGVEV